MHCNGLLVCRRILQYAVRLSGIFTANSRQKSRLVCEHGLNLAVCQTRQVLWVEKRVAAAVQTHLTVNLHNRLNSDDCFQSRTHTVLCKSFSADHTAARSNAAVWSVLGMILLSVSLSVCNAVHCGAQGRRGVESCTAIILADFISNWTGGRTNKEINDKTKMVLRPLAEQAMCHRFLYQIDPMTHTKMIHDPLWMTHDPSI